MRRRVVALPLLLVGLVLVAIPIVGLTETGAEQRLKEAVGYRVGGCEPATDASSPWREGRALRFAWDEPRAVVVRDHAYLLGGVTGLERLDDGGSRLEPIATVMRFDPEAQRYVELAPMPGPVSHQGVATYGDDIYVVGGWGPDIEGPPLDRFARYHVESDRWEELPPLPGPRGAMAVGVIGDRLIVAGGAAGGKKTPRVDAFSFRTGRWERLPDMPTAREHTGAVVADGKLYVLGGRIEHSDAVATAERYDPKTRRWDVLPDMPVPAGGLAAVNLDGAPVAVAGGNDRGGTVTGAVQRFDPSTGTWSRLPDLRRPRHGHGVAVVGNRLYVFGGSPCAYFSAIDGVESLPVGEAVPGSES